MLVNVVNDQAVSIGSRSRFTPQPTFRHWLRRLLPTGLTGRGRTFIWKWCARLPEHHPSLNLAAGRRLPFQCYYRPAIWCCRGRVEDLGAPPSSIRLLS